MVEDRRDGAPAPAHVFVVPCPTTGPPGRANRGGAKRLATAAAGGEDGGCEEACKLTHQLQETKHEAIQPKPRRLSEIQ
jgi:hypothetical protein